MKLAWLTCIKYRLHHGILVEASNMLGLSFRLSQWNHRDLGPFSTNEITPFFAPARVFERPISHLAALVDVVNIKWAMGDGDRYRLDGDHVTDNTCLIDNRQWTHTENGLSVCYHVYRWWPPRHKSAPDASHSVRNARIPRTLPGASGWVSSVHYWSDLYRALMDTFLWNERWSDIGCASIRKQPVAYDRNDCEIILKCSSVVAFDSVRSEYSRVTAVTQNERNS